MSQKYEISLITGDGIGPEISMSAISILQTINDNLGIKFEINNDDKELGSAFAYIK